MGKREALQRALPVSCRRLWTDGSTSPAHAALHGQEATHDGLSGLLALEDLQTTGFNRFTDSFLKVVTRTKRRMGNVQDWFEGRWKNIVENGKVAAWPAKESLCPEKRA